MDNLKVSFPAKDNENYQEKFIEFIKSTARSFRENTDFWDGVYISMKQTLSEGAPKVN